MAAFFDNFTSKQSKHTNSPDEGLQFKTSESVLSTFRSCYTTFHALIRLVTETHQLWAALVIYTSRQGVSLEGLSIFLCGHGFHMLTLELGLFCFYNSTLPQSLKQRNQIFVVDEKKPQGYLSSLY